jgi:hypothetical protein
MKIETEIRDESKYVVINSVTENVEQRVENLIEDGKSICITEISVDDCEALIDRLVQKGYESAVVPVRTVAEHTLNRRTWWGKLCQTLPRPH